MECQLQQERWARLGLRGARPPDRISGDGIAAFGGVGGRSELRGRGKKVASSSSDEEWRTQNVQQVES